jgi:hypothetical protein
MRSSYPLEFRRQVVGLLGLAPVIARLAEPSGCRLSPSTLALSRIALT